MPSLVRLVTSSLIGGVIGATISINLTSYFYEEKDDFNYYPHLYINSIKNGMICGSFLGIIWTIKN